MTREERETAPGRRVRTFPLRPKLIRPQEDPGLAGFPPADVSEAQQARIRVLVRKRPLNGKEKRGREGDVVAVLSPATLAVHEARVKVDLTQYAETHRFTFDEVHDEGATNDHVYASAVAPLIDTVFRRGKASVFACALPKLVVCSARLCSLADGQTGSGKTHTSAHKTAWFAGWLIRPSRQ